MMLSSIDGGRSRRLKYVRAMLSTNCGGFTKESVKPISHEGERPDGRNVRQRGERQDIKRKAQGAEKGRRAEVRRAGRQGKGESAG